MIKLAKQQYFTVPGRVNETSGLRRSGVARVPCALGQEILLRPSLTKRMKIRDRARFCLALILSLNYV